MDSFSFPSAQMDALSLGSKRPSDSQEGGSPPKKLKMDYQDASTQTKPLRRRITAGNKSPYQTPLPSAPTTELFADDDFCEDPSQVPSILVTPPKLRIFGSFKPEYRFPGAEVPERPEMEPLSDDDATISAPSSASPEDVPRAPVGNLRASLVPVHFTHEPLPEEEGYDPQPRARARARARARGQAVRESHQREQQGLPEQPNRSFRHRKQVDYKEKLPQDLPESDSDHSEDSDIVAKAPATSAVGAAQQPDKSERKGRGKGKKTLAKEARARGDLELADELLAPTVKKGPGRPRGKAKGKAKVSEVTDDDEEEDEEESRPSLIVVLRHPSLKFARNDSKKFAVRGSDDQPASNKSVAQSGNKATNKRPTRTKKVKVATRKSTPKRGQGKGKAATPEPVDHVREEYEATLALLKLSWPTSATDPVESSERFAVAPDRPAPRSTERNEGQKFCARLCQIAATYGSDSDNE